MTNPGYKVEILELVVSIFVPATPEIPVIFGGVTLTYSVQIGILVTPENPEILIKLIKEG